MNYSKKLNLALVTAAFVFAGIPSVATAKLPYSFADIAEAALPGVVNIRTTNYTRRDPSLDLYQFFLGGNIPSSSTHSIGTGLVYDKNGHIVTNSHVVSGASVIEVLFAKSKQKIRAKVIGIDLKTDLALLKLQKTSDLVPLKLGDSDVLRVGDIVLAIGNPFGFSHTVTSGIISAKGRVIGTGPYDDFLQTDASIHPGNSGGPLLDVDGKVIGINTAVSAEGQGIGFAIPNNMAKVVIKDLIQYGKVKRPFLGIVGKDILSRDDIDEASSPEVHGFLITNLVSSGPAHRVGLKIGDLVMGFDDKKVMDLNHMQRLLYSKSPADRIRVKIYRRGRGFMNLSVNLEEVPPPRDLPPEKDLF